MDNTEFTAVTLFLFIKTLVSSGMLSSIFYSFLDDFYWYWKLNKTMKFLIVFPISLFIVILLFTWILSNY